MNESGDQNQKGIRKELRERMTGYIAAALGLVAGLAWNDAVKTLIEVLFPVQKNTIPAKFLYAILLTAIVVLITVYLTRITRERDRDS